MSVRPWFVCFIPLALVTGSAAAAQIFLSASDSNPDPAVTPLQTFPLGSTTTLYVWAIPDAAEILNGVSLSLEAATSGVIEADLAAFPNTHTIQNPSITGGQVRWDNVTVQDPQTLDPPPPPGTPGGVLNDGALLFSDWNAAAVIPDTPIPGYTPNHGIDAAGGVNDPLFHAATGAFLHSRLEIKPLAAGITDLFLQVGQQGITSHGQGFEMLRFGPSLTFTDGGTPGATDAEADAAVRVVGILGDTDGNNAVDLTDLNNVRNNFGGLGLGDTNGDGAVDLDDLNNVRNSFGAAVQAAGLGASAASLKPKAESLKPGSPVPEPGGLELFLASLGIFGFFGWRSGFRLLQSGK